MHLRHTARLVLILMTAMLTGCNKFTATNQVISEPDPIAQSDAVVHSGAIAQPGPIAQSEAPSAPVAQSGAVVQSGAIAQSGSIAQSEAPLGPITQSGAVVQSGAIAQSALSSLDPSYPEVIADRLKTTFKDYASYELFEISTPRWVHSFKGWNWLVCVRFLDRGRRRSYALIFNDSKVVEGHYAYQTDNCGTESYVVFEQMRGLGLPPLH
jgi:hypothetical protein